MAIYQVAHQGSGFTVLVDGNAQGTYETRGEAVKAALDMKENNG